jgi:hypothetical protein
VAYDTCNDPGRQLHELGGEPSDRFSDHRFRCRGHPHASPLSLGCGDRARPGAIAVRSSGWGRVGCRRAASW